MACIDIQMFSITELLLHDIFGFDPVQPCTDESKATSKFLSRSKSSAGTSLSNTPDSLITDSSHGCGYNKTETISWNFDDYYDIELKSGNSTTKSTSGTTVYECPIKCCPEGGSVIINSSAITPIEGEARCISQRVEKEGTPVGCETTIKTTETVCANVLIDDCTNPVEDNSQCSETRTCEKLQELCYESYTDAFGAYLKNWEHKVELINEMTLDTFYNITFGRIIKKAKFLANNQPKNKNGTTCGSDKDSCWAIISNKQNLGTASSKSESAQAFLLKAAVKKDDLLKAENKIIKEIKATIMIYTTLDNSQDPPCCGGNFNGEILAQQDFVIKIGEVTFKNDYYSTDTYLLYTNSGQLTSKPLYACIKRCDSC